MIVPQSPGNTHAAYAAEVSTNQDSATESALHIDLHHGYAGLLALKEEWLTLLSGLSQFNLYQHPAWFQAHFEGRNDPEQSHQVDADIAFFAAYRKSQLVGVFPTQWRRRSGLLRHAGLPHAQGMSRTDCCVSEAEDRAALWQQVWQQVANRNWDVYVVAGDGITADAHMFECMDNTPPGQREISPIGLRCGFLDVKPYAEIQAGLKKKFRSNLRRAQTQLDKLGSASFEVHRAGDSLLSAFDAFVALEMAGWKGSATSAKQGYNAGAAIGLYEWKHRFYQTLVSELGAHGCAEVCLLRVDERIIGGQISFPLGDTFYIMKTAYDESARSVSAGHLMIANTLQRCSEARFRQINLVSDYDWVRGWNPRYESYYRIDQFNHTLRGRVGWLRHKIRGGVPPRKS